MPLPIRHHTLKKGETFAGVLRKNGFPASAAKQIYARYNTALKKTKADPKSLAPGDEIRFPAMTAAQIEAAWTQVFEARNTLIDPATSEKNTLVKRLPALKKMASEARALAGEQAKAIKLSDIKFVNPLQKKMETCRKDMSSGANMPMKELTACIAAIGSYHKLHNEMKRDVELQLRDAEQFAARYEQMLADTQTRIAQLDSFVSLVDLTHTRAMTMLGKLAKETY